MAAFLRAYVNAVGLIEVVPIRVWRGARLTLTQVRALRHLARGEASSGKLARDLGVLPASLTRIIDRLEQRGLVRRSSKAGDRRQVVLQLTATGGRISRGIPILHGSSIQRVAERMPRAELRRLTNLLATLAHDVAIAEHASRRRASPKRRED